MNEPKQTDVQDIYTKNIQHYGDLHQQTSKRYDFISWSRLATIILGALALFLMSNWSLIGLFICIALVIIIFLRLVVIHSNLGKQKKHLDKMIQINKDELSYLSGKFTSPHDGEEYLEESHPYAIDLDIFGDRSIFHFINRTRTNIGSNLLAQAFMRPSEIDVVKLRQEASQELSLNLNWRQDFLATAESKENDIDHLKKIQTWLNEPDKILIHPWLNWGRFFVPLLTIALTIFVLVGQYPLSMLIFIILIPGVILAKFAKDITAILNHTEKSQEKIALYAQLILKIEEQSFHSKKLLQLQGKLGSKSDLPASAAIKQLGFFIRQLNVRNNAFAVILNIFGLWDFHWAIALEKWKHKHQEEVEDWFTALGEFDFLISLGNIRYNYPHWIYPTLEEDRTKISASQLKHPLIFGYPAVGNDLDLDITQKVMLITGSNMAGKSTFLRSVGVNLVMAYSGSPVNALELDIPILNVFTSMRTRDNLHESTSSFYAELKRLQSAMKGVENQPNTFVLFDEILKGTNSVDRHKGAKAIIQQIIDGGRAGIVATHDLDLAKMENESNGKVENWCFDVLIKNGKLDFDYLIKKGVCSSFNASFLMKEMGFKVDVQE